MAKKCIICGSEKDLVKIGKHTYKICVDCVAYINQAHRNQQVHCVSESDNTKKEPKEPWINPDTFSRQYEIEASKEHKPILAFLPKPFFSSVIHAEGLRRRIAFDLLETPLLFQWRPAAGGPGPG